MVSFKEVIHPPARSAILADSDVGRTLSEAETTRKIFFKNSFFLLTTTTGRSTLGQSSIIELIDNCSLFIDNGPQTVNYEQSAMSSKLLDDLGQLQRAVMEVVWQLGQASVHQVREQLAQKKELAYTTVLTAMQKLEKAGWLKHRAEGKSYVYLPTRSREQAGAKSAMKFIKRVLDGDALLMFQHLIRQSNLSNQELAELRKTIDQKRKEMKNDK